MIEVSDADSFAMTRRLAREEALLVGGSSGMAAAAAIRLAQEIDDPDAVIVVLLPDSGRGYLTKVFSDEWLTRYGFAPRPDQTRPGGRRRAAREVRRPAVAGAHPSRTRRSPRPSRSCASTACRQMPVVRAEPPVMAAEVVGSVSERGLLGALFGRRVRPGGRGGAA